jgi:hypothetical protein
MTASATPENYTTLTDVTSAQHCSAAQDHRHPPIPTCGHGRLERAISYRRLTAFLNYKYLEKLKMKKEPGKQGGSPMKKLTERDHIRIHAQTKNEQLKAEAIDILIDAIHRQTRGGVTVSFDHNLALKIEKLIIGNMRRAQIIALVRTGIH